MSLGGTRLLWPSRHRDQEGVFKGCGLYGSTYIKGFFTRFSMKVVVTGGAGFIGSHLVAARNGDEIVLK